MKSILAAAALAIGLSPGIGMACEYGDETSASTSPPEQVASTPAPAATKMPAPKVAKVTPSALKPVASKSKASDPKVAASSN